MHYEKLLIEAEQSGIDVFEVPMAPTVKGLYGEGAIWINGSLSNAEKACILAEEMGHHHKTAGVILDQKHANNRKQELIARTWAYEKMMPLSSIIQAHQLGIQNRYELSEYLGVPEDFIESALKRYQEKYGTHVSIDGYTIIFNPLGVLEFFDF